VSVGGHLVVHCLRHRATNQKVAGLIPDSVIGILHCHNPSGHTNGPGVDSSSHRNEHQEYFVGVKASDT
jgi:aspartate carbamoyltransferase regulatory subunit